MAQLVQVVFSVTTFLLFFMVLEQILTKLWQHLILQNTMWLKDLAVAVHLYWMLLLYVAGIFILILGRRTLVIYSGYILIVLSIFWIGIGYSFHSLYDGFKIALLFVLILAPVLVGACMRIGSLAFVGPLAVLGTFGLFSAEMWKLLLGLMPVVLACMGLGGLVRQLVFRLEEIETITDERELDRWVLDTATGAAILSLVGFAFGITGIAQAPILVFTTLCFAAMGFGHWWRRLREAYAVLRATSSQPTSVLVLAGAAVGIWGLTFFGTLGPEMGSDALGGRVALPVRIARTGIFLPDPPMSGIGLGWAGGELFYLWLVPWVGTSVARIWAWWVMGVLLLWALGRARGNGWPLLGWIAIFASTQAWWQTISGFVDMHQALLAFAATLSLAKGGFQPTPLKLGLTMFLAGSVAATKMNGLAVALSLGLAAVFRVWKGEDRNLSEMVKLGTGGAVGLLTAVGPWALRSLTLTGNPTFPFFNQLWQSPLAPLWPVRVPFGPTGGLVGWFLMPWTLFFSPEKYSEVGGLNPALLFIVPWVGQVVVTERTPRLYVWVAAIWFVLWAITDPNSRYLLPGTVVFLGTFASSQSVLRSYGRLWMVGIAILVILGFLSTILDSFFWPGRTVNYWLFRVFSTHQELLERIPSYKPCVFLNERYGRNYKIWQINIRDFLYCEGDAYETWHEDYRMARYFAQWLVGEGSSPEEIAQQLRRWGFTHVMYRLDLAEEWRHRVRPSSVLSSQMEDCCLVPEFAWNNVRVLRVVIPKEKQGSWLPCPSGEVVENGEERILYRTSFPGGELVRWRLSASLREKGKLEATLSLRDRAGNLLGYFKQVWPADLAPVPWDIWQTIPANGAIAWVEALAEDGWMGELHCDIWQARGEG